MKGLRQVRAEFSLSTLAYNLLRAVNIVGVKTLVEAHAAALTRPSPGSSGAPTPSEAGFTPACSPRTLTASKTSSRLVCPRELTDEPAFSHNLKCFVRQIYHGTV